MNSRLPLFLIALLCVPGSLSSQAIGPDFTHTTASSTDGKLVPYTLDLEGTVGFRIPITPCLISTPEGPAEGVIFVGSGTGYGAHLGKSTWTSSECGDPVTGRFQDGFLVITAANGDTLNIEFEGTFSTATWPFPAAEFDVIAGGTGRFADAQGWGTSNLNLFVSFDADGNPISPWPITLSGAGRISY